MINTIFTSLVGSALYVTSSAFTPAALGAQVALTQYIPQDNFVTKPVEAKKAAVIAKPIVVTPIPTQDSIPTVSPVVTQRVVQAAPSSFDSVYKAAGARYGIPWQILYGIHMTESGGRDGAISSGRGPQGPMQFMPGTWASYGVDGNGDGIVDINNAQDAIYGAANYIAKHGSIDAGLRAYGGNYSGVLAIARSAGY
jgi:membrane-bound lytic murein transglycosylase B